MGPPEVCQPAYVRRHPCVQISGRRPVWSARYIAATLQKGHELDKCRMGGEGACHAAVEGCRHQTTWRDPVNGHVEKSSQDVGCSDASCSRDGSLMPIRSVARPLVVPLDRHIPPSNACCRGEADRPRPPREDRQPERPRCDGDDWRVLEGPSFPAWTTHNYLA